MNYQLTNQLIKVVGTLHKPCSNLNRFIVPAINSYFGIYRRGSALKHITCSRCVTTHSRTAKFAKQGLFEKLWHKIKFYMFYKSKWKAAGFFLYENMADNINFEEFFEEFALPDTFNSWFLVTELHIWMLMVKTMEEGDDGRYIRNCIVVALWEDTRQKIKNIGVEHYSAARDQVNDLSEHFQAALLTYDEGILRDDKVLASALWRRFFSKQCYEAEQIERMVQYVRKQMYQFDNLSADDFLQRKFKWIKLKEITVPSS